LKVYSPFIDFQSIIPYDHLRKLPLLMLFGVSERKTRDGNAPINSLNKNRTLA
jgi:hypothetical protein